MTELKQLEKLLNGRQVKVAKKLIPGDLVRMSNLAGDRVSLSNRPSPLLIAPIMGSTITITGDLLKNSIAMVLACDCISVTSVYVIGSNGSGWVAAALLIKALIQTGKPLFYYFEYIQCHHVGNKIQS